MIETPHVRDPRTGIMVYSLYSEVREPTEEMLADIDTFVVDLQDVGCRIYTFIYTMANCMCAAKKYGKRVVVCDRPNPIGGDAVEGNITEHEFKSFVGQFELPTRHGMTIGELAKMFNEHFGIGCDLEVVEMRTGAARCGATKQACRGCCLHRTFRTSTRVSFFRRPFMSKVPSSARAAERRCLSF